MNRKDEGKSFSGIEMGSYSMVHVTCRQAYGLFVLILF